MKVGKKAPDFALRDKDRNTYTLKSFTTKYIILYFYPKDDTPGCTLEAKGFGRELRRLSMLDASVVGVSGGDEKTKAKFCKKYKLKTLLLSDPDFRTAKAYRSFGKKTFMGKTYNGIFRNTYLLDDRRRVVKLFPQVDPKSHPKEIRLYIEKLEAKKARVVKPEQTEVQFKPRLPKSKVRAKRSVTRPTRKGRVLPSAPRRPPRRPTPGKR